MPSQCHGCHTDGNDGEQRIGVEWAWSVMVIVAGRRLPYLCSYPASDVNITFHPLSCFLYPIHADCSTSFHTGESVASIAGCVEYDARNTVGLGSDDSALSLAQSRRRMSSTPTSRFHLSCDMHGYTTIFGTRDHDLLGGGNQKTPQKIILKPGCAKQYFTSVVALVLAKSLNALRPRHAVVCSSQPTIHTTKDLRNPRILLSSGRSSFSRDDTEVLFLVWICCPGKTR